MIWGGSARIARHNGSHAHEMHELVVCRGDSGVQWLAGEAHAFVRGRLFLLPEGSPHEVAGREDAPAELFYVCFGSGHFLSEGPAGMHELVQGLLRRRCHSSGDDSILARQNLELGARLEEELQAPQPYGKERAGLLLGELLINFQRSLALPLAPSSRHAARIAALCEEQRHGAEALTLEEAARRCAMGRSLFASEFKLFTGLTYLNFQHQLKLKLARELLAGSDLPVTEVAERAGFHHLGHFEKLFRRHHAFTPLRYRQRVREQGPCPQVYIEKRKKPGAGG